jgi:hypothetical protein
MCREQEQEKNEIGKIFEKMRLAKKIYLYVHGAA